MNYNDYITLVSVQTSVDALGDTVEVRNEKRVFCRIKSVSQLEFYQAQAQGLKPEIKFVLADYFDYNDEPVLEYRDRLGRVLTYKIIRTFRSETSNELELVCTRGL